MALAQTIGKLEGWKYTPLFAVDQTSWQHAQFRVKTSLPLSAGQKDESIVFDNPGDQIIAQRILNGASEDRHLDLGTEASKEIDSALSVELSNGEAFGALSIRAQGTYPLSLFETVSLTQARGEMLQTIAIDAGAQLTHIRIVDCDEASVLFAPVQVRVARGGTYRQVIVSRGAATARMTTQIELIGEGAHADLRAVHLLSGERHMDQFIVMRHDVPHCTSSQNLRYVIGGEARGAFQGKIMVARDAQKTAAYQLCRALLLSEAAQMNTKPELEIFADDVKCSHGATTGMLDERALFYLQSRGIPRDEAQALLMQAFIEDALLDIELPAQAKTAIAEFLK